MKNLYPPRYSSATRVINIATGKNPIRCFWDATTGVMDIVAFDNYCKHKFHDYSDDMSLSEFLQKKDPTLWLARLVLIQRLTKVLDAFHELIKGEEG